MWNFSQISFLTFLTGPDQQKCGFLANFHFWTFWQVRTCKNVKFWPIFIFGIFDRCGTAKMWIFSQLPFLTLLTVPEQQKCGFLANFHFWDFWQVRTCKMWIFSQLPFLKVLTGPDLQKCEILASFHYWHFRRVRTCKNIDF